MIHLFEDILVECIPVRFVGIHHFVEGIRHFEVGIRAAFGLGQAVDSLVGCNPVFLMEHSYHSVGGTRRSVEGIHRFVEGIHHFVEGIHHFVEGIQAAFGLGQTSLGLGIRVACQVAVRE